MDSILIRFIYIDTVRIKYPCNCNPIRIKINRAEYYNAGGAKSGTPPLIRIPEF